MKKRHTAYANLACLLLLSQSAALLATTAPYGAAEAAGCNVQIQGRFIEGAPRDRFVFSNNSADGWNIVQLMLALENSNGKLIFDTTDQGAGVEVFQPFRTESNSASLSAEPDITDGDQNVTLSFSRFTAGQTFQFSIDVDDQLTRSELGQIRVANSEMQGALVQLEVVSEKGQRMNLTVEFDGSSRFEVIADDC